MISGVCFPGGDSSARMKQRKKEWPRERDKHPRRSKDDSQQLEKVDWFRGVSFDNWLRTFHAVLSHILMSNGYRSKEKQVTIRLAIIIENYTVVVEQSRKLINAYQFNNEPMRLPLSSLASGLRPTDSLISSTLQKHMLREELMRPKTTPKMPVTRSTLPLRVTRNRCGCQRRTTHFLSPCMDSCAALQPRAIRARYFYLLHAYDYCQEDPIICICICLALSSLGRAMQRQADNRNHLIAQGMACVAVSGCTETSWRARAARNRIQFWQSVPAARIAYPCSHSLRKTVAVRRRTKG
ncbi:hypothetical protein HD554DRAFT_1309138 [Boletus coccyginus]|nr:hypothetical protein HD554DRAFT_1309138 [Boletus coccyginus]